MSEGKVQQKQQARRAEIVAAAQRCFAAKGLHGASVADIAREAGLSVGHTLFPYTTFFRLKDYSYVCQDFDDSFNRKNVV